MEKLEHPNIVHLLEVIDDPEHHNHFLILEYITGGTLQERLQFSKQNDNSLTLIQIKKIFTQLLQAVQYLHISAKVVHGDIKPENILLDSNLNVKLADFGTSKRIGKKQSFKGTDLYLSPEAVCGDNYDGVKADIWACGIILY